MGSSPEGNEIIRSFFSGSLQFAVIAVRFQVFLGSQVVMSSKSCRSHSFKVNVWQRLVGLLRSGSLGRRKSRSCLYYSLFDPLVKLLSNLLHLSRSIRLECWQCKRIFERL